jgi:hypothetical protein
MNMPDNAAQRGIIMVAIRGKTVNEKSFFAYPIVCFFYIIPGWHFNSWEGHSSSYHSCRRRGSSWVCVLRSYVSPGSHNTFSQRAEKNILDCGSCLLTDDWQPDLYNRSRCVDQKADSQDGCLRKTKK